MEGVREAMVVLVLLSEHVFQGDTLTLQGSRALWQQRHNNSRGRIGEEMGV